MAFLPAAAALMLLCMWCGCVEAKLLTDAELLALYGPAPVAAPRALLVPRDAAQSLRDAAAARGLFIGTAINLGCLTNASEPQYKSIAAATYSLTTAENECKVQGTEPQFGVFTLASCEALGGWTMGAQGMNGTFRGHNTCWGTYNPQYLVDAPKDQLLSMLQEHIAKLVPAHLPDAPAYSWDVVNEVRHDPPPVHPIRAPTRGSRTSLQEWSEGARSVRSSRTNSLHHRGSLAPTPAGHCRRQRRAHYLQARSAVVPRAADVRR